jgi:Rod binding domain-containing protein
MNVANSNTLSVVATDNLSSPHLVKASQDFEAMMLKELLKPLTSDTTVDGSDSGSGSGSALGEYASEALGRALSQQGGFGIATRIQKDLSLSGNQAQSGTVTTKLHNDTVVRTIQ